MTDGGDAGPGADDPTALAVTPSGKFLFVADVGTSMIARYQIGSSDTPTDVTGKLVPLSPPGMTSGTAQEEVAVNNPPTLAFVTNPTEATITQYAIDGGALTPLSPLHVSTDAGPATAYGIAFDPAQAYLYVTDYNANLVHQYRVMATGLASLTPPSVSVPKGSGLMVVTPALH